MDGKREPWLLMMWYVIAATVILLAAAYTSRRLGRRAVLETCPIEDLPVDAVDHPAVAEPELGMPVPVAVRLIPAPGAPNTDPPTDRHITPRGTVSIHRRVGRRRTTTDG
jgi:hypothetical protein